MLRAHVQVRGEEGTVRVLPHGRHQRRRAGHSLVTAVHVGRGRVGVPQLPQARRRLGRVHNLVAIRRVAGGQPERHGHVHPAVLRQSFEQVARADDTDVEVSSASDHDVMHQRVEHCGGVVRDVEPQRDRHSSLPTVRQSRGRCARAVWEAICDTRAFHAEEVAVELSLELRKARGPTRGVCGLVEVSRHDAHHLEVCEVRARRDHRQIRPGN
eukprot:2785423-Prymnesium_polylepis.2